MLVRSVVQQPQHPQRRPRRRRPRPHGAFWRRPNTTPAARADGQPSDATRGRRPQECPVVPGGHSPVSAVRAERCLLDQVGILSHASHDPCFVLYREIALEVLGREPVGAFMVRESTTKLGCFALSLRVPRDFQPSGIAHYLILRTNKGYKIKVR